MPTGRPGIAPQKPGHLEAKEQRDKSHQSAVPLVFLDVSRILSRRNRDGIISIKRLESLIKRDEADEWYTTY